MSFIKVQQQQSLVTIINMKKYTATGTSIAHSFAVASFGIMIISALFLAVEPQITQGQSSEFSVSQVITSENAFAVEPTDISMTGSIAGLTGGQATGTTDFAVQSNNSSGYYVEIAFENNGTDQVMLGEVSASEAIRNYGGDAAGPQPSRGYVSSSSAQFAYTVTSDFSSDTAQSFFHDGATCNAGVSQAVTCWKSPDTSAFEIVRRTGPALTRATSTIMFNVTVPSGATPIVQSDTYTATATLSLISL